MDISGTRDNPINALTGETEASSFCKFLLDDEFMK